MPPLPAALARAVQTLHAGGLVAFPTETVYGLGANARDEAAIKRIFDAKGRPQDHPLIVHLAPGAPLEAWTPRIPPTATLLSRAFWPGPLTLVLERHPSVPASVSGGLPTIALRVPAHPVAQALLTAFGGGIAAPSANRFGEVSPTTAAHVEKGLGPAVDVILDGGPCEVGVESTIVDLSGPAPRILRPGGITRDELAGVVGADVPDAAGPVKAPGALPWHYAPAAKVLVVEPAEVSNVAIAQLAKGHRVAALVPADTPLPAGARLVPFSRVPDDAARRLYAALREVDDLGCDVAVVPQPNAEGIGVAVLDRLVKAAGPRG